ncbi:MAG: tetratricopeptide repeat protein [Acidobacteria bacterium]|nr:tetratricopeptide repeat protein [Acidobacteriota bacterium]NIM61318.1 tetratricopeptide repeat protein [Acidobacteriota bacterium]NIO58782.1 tetratricopeptide repeat protein [Acidobacteriota bacterium]NIQ29825.1 tetratricopeptide repeat protein [Acidobacteriota bacterium]NIQ84548.1 tetratricopeptide repeat protein [Acidobacteriota bacterium]
MTASALLVSVILAFPTADYDEVVERGRAALRDRDYAAAAAAFEEAVELRPDEVDAWFRLGLARSANDEPGAAIAAYGRAAELDETHAQARNNLGNVLFRRGDYEEALKWYERALAIRPDYLVALYHRGWVLRHFNRNEEAEAAFNRCLELSPQGARERSTRLDCLFFAGTMRFRAEDYEGAAAAMTRLIESNAGHIEARYYLGMAYRHLGRVDEAREQLEIHRRMTRAVRRDEPIEKDDP